MKNYSTTYAGIIVIILGWLGFANLVSDTEVSTLVDHVLQLVGIVTAIIGRYKSGGVTPLGFKK